MALAETTLSSAVSVNAKSIVVASATSITPGRLILIDGENMVVTKDYVSGTTIPVIRGQGGTVTQAHVVTARVTHGDAADFSAPGVGTVVNYPNAGRSRQVVSITATSTLTLPPAGTDLFVILNGTSVITLTIPVPTKDMDGTYMTIVANGAAAHVLTFTGGLGGAGTSYDVLTLNGTGTAGTLVCACNEVWVSPVMTAMAGTLTNVTATLT